MQIQFFESCLNFRIHLLEPVENMRDIGKQLVDCLIGDVVGRDYKQFLRDLAKISPPREPELAGC